MGNFSVHSNSLLIAKSIGNERVMNYIHIVLENKKTTTLNFQEEMMFYNPLLSESENKSLFFCSFFFLKKN